MSPALDAEHVPSEHLGGAAAVLSSPPLGQRFIEEAAAAAATKALMKAEEALKKDADALDKALSSAGAQREREAHTTVSLPRL